MKGIKTVIIPCAGLGTRFYPLTKYIPKELLPIGNKPLIDWAVREALESGAETIIIIINNDKELISDYLAGEYPDTNIKYLYQNAWNDQGLGAAILRSEQMIETPLFSVILPDVVHTVRNCVGPLVELRERQKLGTTIIGVQDVSDEKMHQYGIVEGTESEGSIKVSRLLEKPGPFDTTSRLAIVGRYVLNQHIFTYLRKTKPGHNNEIQLTDALDLLADSQPVYAHPITAQLSDVGTPEGVARFYRS